MYPDPITPRAFPEILSRLDYDPFAVMPGGFPAAPRVFTTAAQIERAGQRVKNGIPADSEGLKQLLAACRLEEPLPAYKDEGGPADWGGPLLPWLNLAFRNALAAHLTGEDHHRQRALEAMRLAAQAAAKVSRWTGHEHNEAIAAARAYDLLAASPLNPNDDNALRGMLWMLHHADYALDGSIVFEAEWFGSEQIWHLANGQITSAVYQPTFTNELSPTVLPDGRIVTLWLERPGNAGGAHELTLLAADGTYLFTLLPGQDVDDIGISAGQ